MDDFVEVKDPRTRRVVAVHRDWMRACRVQEMMWFDELYTLNLTKKNHLDLLDILL